MQLKRAARFRPHRHRRGYTCVAKLLWAESWRIGYRRSILTLIPALGVALCNREFCRRGAGVFPALVPVGIVIGGIEDHFEPRSQPPPSASIGHRIVDRAHAFWSLGFFSAGIISALVAQSGSLAADPLIPYGTDGHCGRGVDSWRFDPAPHRTGTSNEKPAQVALPTMAVMALVAVTLTRMWIMEGAGIDWAAIYMRDMFAAPPFLSGFAVALGGWGAGADAVFADPFVERSSPTACRRHCSECSAWGALLVFFAPSGWLALVGFAMMGVGTSVIFPLAMSAAAQLTDRPASTNVASLARSTFVAFLLGPPLLGYVAEHFASAGPSASGCH